MYIVSQDKKTIFNANKVLGYSLDEYAYEIDALYDGGDTQTIAEYSDYKRAYNAFQGLMQVLQNGYQDTLYYMPPNGEDD